MDSGFAFSEVVRKLSNLIRVGKIIEKQEDKVKVQIGEIITPFLPIVSTSGNTIIFIPIAIGEQVIVISPYGELAQAFVIRSIYYNRYKAPQSTDVLTCETSVDVDVTTSKGFYVKAGDSSISLKDGTITLSSGSSNIRISSSGIELSCDSSRILLGNSLLLSCGGSDISISGSNISLFSSNISTNPLICKCTGGL